MAEAIIIDTDPGQDDAFAILLALASPELEVLGLTTVAGNVPVAVTAANARRVVELAGRSEIPVRAGCERPLLRPARFAEEVHGKSGLDGWDFPAPARPPEPGHAVDWMVETLLARPDGATTLVPVGPLTNVAMALRRCPAIARKIRRIVLMGGGFFQGGNMSPAAEFNILVDPEAAAIVFGAGIDLVAVPIDCTYAAPTPDSWITDLEALGTRVGAAGAGMMRFFQRFGNEKYGTATRPLHDALAVGYLLWPDLFTGRRCNIEIETASPLTLGMTVVDWWGISGRPANGMWLTGCDAPAFYGRMLERLARLG
ncbi:nucleoside hydrolase [Inquilinus sp. NPDC058860]|uniref:nucleoside hydrolase n=1 Tax=Inquilinus sp. NPDC058860 TaxID=3346652 RepID=UPI00368D40DC